MINIGLKYFIMAKRNWKISKNGFSLNMKSSKNKKLKFHFLTGANICQHLWANGNTCSKLLKFVKLQEDLLEFVKTVYLLLFDSWYLLSYPIFIQRLALCSARPDFHGGKVCGCLVGSVGGEKLGRRTISATLSWQFD